MNIFQSLNPEKCCGCTACVSACPIRCISMIEDEKGFLRPHIDSEKCINCGKCEKVCPAIHQSEERIPIKVWAAKNNDETVRLSSSSGGIFMALAEWIIKRGGVVFGARFDENWEVMHDYAETLEAAEAFKGSKYVQSRMCNCYEKAKAFLEVERWVLFTGTQCQIAGLKHYLGKDYEKLITVDVICHGVPSPLIWNHYFHFIKNQNPDYNWTTIKGISFRDKAYGWKRFGLSFRFHPFQKSTNENSINSGSFSKEKSCLFSGNLFEDLYFKGFLNGLYHRPSCYCCPAKAGRSMSDLTIGDYWGLPKELKNWDDDKGISLILVFTEKGTSVLEELRLEKRHTTYKKGVKRNPNFAFSSKKPKTTELFWKLFPEDGIEAIRICVKKMEPSIVHRYIMKCYWLIRKIVKI